MPWLWRVRIVGRSDGFESATSADSNKMKYGSDSTRPEVLGGYPLSQAAKSYSDHASIDIFQGFQNI
jgi:hypothetical protein